ncbi:MAG: hypothetical protein R3E18_04950 [Sphingomonadaceae bacterium]|nr:hypothetical protein [Sphingomonadaceae bacterium]
MTVLDQFVSFARELPAEQRHLVEDVLASMMESLSSSGDFTQAELDELDRRTAAKPEFSDPETIASLFGKPFSA